MAYLSYVTINHIENGHNEPYITTCERIAKAITVKMGRPVEVSDIWPGRFKDAPGEPTQSVIALGRDAANYRAALAGVVTALTMARGYVLEYCCDDESKPRIVQIDTALHEAQEALNAK
jgi:DNA-binding XRE family transcriptional regulator